MAQITNVTIVDDLGGNGAAETIRFALDGKHYQIDLNHANAKAFRKSLQTYIDAGRRAPRPVTFRPARPRALAAGHDPKSVRSWAISKGIGVPTRGRIPESIVKQYEAATR